MRSFPLNPILWSLVSTSLTFAAHAADENNKDTTGQDEQIKLEQIVVTAQKKVENIQTVPVSVVALGMDDLGNMKMRNTQEIVSQAPNVQMLGSNGDAQLVLGA